MFWKSAFIEMLADDRHDFVLDEIACGLLNHFFCRRKMLIQVKKIDCLVGHSFTSLIKICGFLLCSNQCSTFSRFSLFMATHPAVPMIDPRQMCIKIALPAPGTIGFVL